MMKLILVACFLLSFSTSYAQVIADENFEFEDSKDYLDVEFNNSYLDHLVKEIDIYSNVELKGIPILKIVPADGSDFKKHQLDNKISYDFLIFNPNTSLNGFYIKIESCENSICRVENKGKSYYFKLEKSFFKRGIFPWSSIWRKFSNGEAQEKYNKLINDDSSFRNTIFELNLCINKKNQSCLAKITSTIESSLIVNAHKLWVVNNLSCKEIASDKFVNHRYWALTSGEVDSIETKTMIPWNLFEKLTNNKQEEKKIIIRTKNFGGIDSIEILIPGKSYCGGNYTTQLVLNFKKVKNIWKVTLDDFVPDKGGFH